MFKPKNIPTDHKDLIHDVAYNYHGRRMATCSSDQYVKIWDIIDGEWKCTASLKTHTGSVWRVVWAHPEFGQVIATCSFDRTASIWEELPGDDGQWIKRGMLVDSRTSVQDVKFAPKHLGLQLAICSSDGVVRIYEAPDIMNLNNWPLKDKIECKQSCSCISWNPSRVHAPMIAVGSDDTNQSSGSKVMIYEYSDNTRSWTRTCDCPVSDSVRDVAFAPNLGRSYHILAVAAKDVLIFTLRPDTKTRRDCLPQLGLPSVKQVAQFDDHNSQVWRLSWNITGTILASSGDDGCVRLWKVNYLDNWKCIAVMKGDGSTSQNQDNKLGNGSGSNGSAATIPREMTPPQPNVPLSIRRNALWPYLRTKKDESKIFY